MLIRIVFTKPQALAALKYNGDEELIPARQSPACKRCEALEKRLEAARELLRI